MSEWISANLWSIPVFVVVGAGVALCAAWLLRRVRSSTALGVALLLFLFQFYLHGYVSVALGVTALFIPAIVWQSRRDRHAPTLFVFALVGLVVWGLVAFFWSENLGSVLMPTGLVTCVLAMFLLARRALAERNGLARVARIVAPGVAVFSLIVIVFQVFPAAEGAYLRSPLAHLLSEPDALHYPKIWHNVFDPDKAGGLLLNGNTASVTTALAAVGLAAAAIRLRSWYLAAIAATAALATVMTGSKSPLMIVAAIAVVGIVTVLAARRLAVVALAVAAAVVALGTAALAIGVRLPVGMSYLLTFDDRVRLWGFAARLFPDHWLLGLGFNNWSPALRDSFGDVFPERVFQDFPPHSFVVEAWAQAGLIYLALTLLVAALPVVWATTAMFRAARAGVNGRFWISALIWAATLWAPLHSLTDTTQFYGDQHSLALYAVVAAAAWALRISSSDDGDELCDDHSHLGQGHAHRRA